MLPIHKFATVFTVVINYFPWITDHLEMPTTAHTQSWNFPLMKPHSSLSHPICTIILYFFMIYFIIILSIPVHVNWCFPVRSLKFGILCTSLPYVLHDLATTCSIPSSKHNISWSIQIMKNAIYIVIPTSYYFLPAKFKYSPQLSLP